MKQSLQVRSRCGNGGANKHNALTDSMGIPELIQQVVFINIVTLGSIGMDTKIKLWNVNNQESNAILLANGTIYWWIVQSNRGVL